MSAISLQFTATDVQESHDGQIELRMSLDVCNGYTQLGDATRWLKQQTFVTLKRISTKLSDNMSILSFNSYIRFHANIYVHCQNINKSHRGLLLYVHPVD